MRQSGGRLRSRFLPALLVLATGCWSYGFAGGGLPSHIHTVAVLPFDNETASPALQRELHDRMRREVEGRLGLRAASESRADAVVRGRILRYEPDIPSAYSSDPRVTTAARRRLQITVDVEIVDQTSGRVLWERKGLTADGEYSERGEDDGRRQALEKLVADVIAGAQSQW
ncbi:MAG: DUF4136 domain-containing protein [Gemmatimonadota bacterium]|nr:DUF4136 domain-containing protein [Gemmatimonadota bacterium]